MISYLLVPKIETCFKYFLDKIFSIAAIVDSNNRALSSSDVLGTYAYDRFQNFCAALLGNCSTKLHHALHHVIHI